MDPSSTPPKEPYNSPGYAEDSKSPTPEPYNSPGYNEDFEAPSPVSDSHNSPGYAEDFEEPHETAAVVDVAAPDKEEEIKTEFYNMVNMYYNYKYQYEDAKQQMKRRISYSPEEMSKEEARKAYNKTKPPCVNCGRNVGTIFATEFRTSLTEDDFRRTLIAKCGDKTSPCILDIQISMPFMTLFDETIDPTKESINNYKKRIIRIKNEVMFGYTPEEDAIKRYTAIGELLKEDEQLLKDTIAVRDAATKEKQKRTQLAQAEALFEKDLEEFKRLTQEYKVTKNEQFLKDSTMIYTDHILKTTRAITNIKYDYNEIEYDVDTDTYTLVQKQFPLNVQQNYSGEDVYETVLKFVKGNNLTNQSNQAILNAHNKTIKKAKAVSAAIAKNKPKTRKQKSRDTRIKEKLSITPPGASTLPVEINRIYDANKKIDFGSE
jgi:hypothetical protein